MAEILPIRAWRYNDRFARNIEELTSPLFDVVSAKQRQALYANPFNSIHLSVPLGDEPGKEALTTLSEWKGKNVITQDAIPGIYVYYQFFRFPGEEHESCRKGFIAQIKAYDWDERVVLRHENTISKAVNDRLDLLRATEFQPSPTHGLYEDPLHELEPYMDDAIKDPIYDIEDYQGVREVLAVIHDASVIRKFLEVMANKKIILADGHHRYEGAIGYRKEQQSGRRVGRRWNASDFHMMYFTNALSKDLRILPTHRIFRGFELKEEEVIERLKACFSVRKLNDVDEISELILQKDWAFGLVFPENAYKITLKPECFALMDLQIPEPVKRVDMTVLHYFFVDKVLGIPMETQRHSDKIDYERNLMKCVLQVESGNADFAVVAKEVKMSEVLEVCNSGFTMPQKSTYFFPKTLSGLLFASIKQEEFDFPYEAFLP
jgi:uncharacterized protein (DUF1015 family)